MILNYCPACGQRNPGIVGHKPNCKYTFMQRFRAAEARGDDITCMAILEEMKKRNLPLIERRKNATEETQS